MEIKKFNGGILFPFFREIIEFYWPKMPDYEIADLFRETWCLGNGKITTENFLTMVTEKCLLSRIASLPSTHVLPELRVDEKYVAADDKDEYAKLMNRILTKYHKHSTTFEGIKSITLRLGSERI